MEGRLNTDETPTDTDEGQGLLAIGVDRLPPKVKALLALPKAELKKAVAARRALLAVREKAKKEAKAKGSRKA